MKTKIEIKSIWDTLLFEFEKENNSIKETLQEARKQGAYLQSANLRGADLQGASLQGANLQRADLQGAYLQGADLRGAYLQSAYLQRAYLQDADLRDAYLHGAYLQRAYLQGADLQSADLQGAYLQSAYLRGADLRRASSLNTILPEGELIVWKKLQVNLIAKLLIPIKAKRVNCIGSRKCRFEYCKVIAIYDGKKKVNEGRGQYNKNLIYKVGEIVKPDKLIYKVGEIVKPDKFDSSPLIECSNGIHAFITRLEAEEY